MALQFSAFVVIASYLRMLLGNLLAACSREPMIGKRETAGVHGKRCACPQLSPCRLRSVVRWCVSTPSSWQWG